MAKTIKGADLSAILEQELTRYHHDVTDRINKLSEGAAKTLVKRTRASAPVRSGGYRKRIAYQRSKQGLNGDTYVWYVKPPDHRLTHLLVHGHGKRNGGRVKGDPFLVNALDEVLPKYEREVKEAVQDG